MGLKKAAEKYQDIKIFPGALFIFKNRIYFTGIEGSLVDKGHLQNVTRVAMFNNQYRLYMGITMMQMTLLCYVNTEQKTCHCCQ